MISKIYLAGDHAGFKLKEKLKLFLVKGGYKIEDLGPYEYNPDDDYPDFVMPLAKKVAKEKNSRGILIAGSGQGEAIAANRIINVRAALYHGGSTKIVEMARKHNNANILSFGARFVKEAEVKKAINLFLNVKFEAGRHARRIKKIEKYSQKL
ncbi:MAG TPA: RpiB/LacA/LacB family sugar-phosphate isomerase [Candidatus Nanoarchaeia archaeon]|nr:RpiB/LacA/LacB family sugar-phosphate isomerase [Candidatus Nanoarchaeia archaeon]